MIDHIIVMEEILENNKPLYLIDYDKYKEIWYLCKDDVDKLGSIVGVITKDNEFICYEIYREKILRFNRKEKIKKLQHE